MISLVAGITIPIYANCLGATPLIVGIIGATGGILYSFMPVVSGFLSDKFGRRIFVSLSAPLYSISCLLYLLTGNPYTFIPIKALESFSIALFWPSIEALLVENSGINVEEVLQKFNLSWGTAAMIGPAIGGNLISALGVKTTLLISSLLSIALFPIIIMKIGRLRGEEAFRPRYSISWFGWGWFLSILTAVLSTFLLSFAAGIIYNIFPAYAFNLGIPAYEIGLMILLVGLFRLLAFLEAYRLKSRIGETKIFLAGSLLMALASTIMAPSRTTLFFSISLSIFGFSIGLLYAASIAIFLKKGRGGEGQAAGLFECLLGIGYFLGPLLGGLAAEFSSEAPYVLILILTVSISIFHIFHRSTKV
ncbi:MFS transporter [Candidatus Bathyarchaeota archaeon]|nr:MFS transporter [Candidatus Bathyarchaeota archaeon]